MVVHSQNLVFQYLAPLALTLGIGCTNFQAPPKEIEEYLKPLKREFTAYCEEGNSDLNAFYKGRKNSWVKARKDALMEIMGCPPEGIEWVCAGGSLANPFHVEETWTSKRCDYPALYETISEPGDISRYAQEFRDIMLGRGAWSYESWTQRANQ